MDTVTPQEIMSAYLCVIGTVALVLWWSRVSGRDDCDPPRAGQSEPKKKGAGGPRRAECVQRSARDMRAPEARAAHGMREPAFSRSAPVSIGIGNGALGRAHSSSLRDAYVREFLLIHSAPASIAIETARWGERPRPQRGADEREASLVQSAPALLETSGLTRGGMPWDGGGQRAGPTPSSARMRANAREAPATPRSPSVPPACARWLFENECGVSALEERCAEKRERDKRER